MLPLLLNKIIQTDKLLFLHLVTQKNRIYTFLNPVSYLIALAYIIHSGFISGYQNRYGDNLKPPTNVYHRMTA